MIVPHVMIQPIWVQLSRTAVIQAMIRSICAVVSPRGRRVSLTEARSAPDTTACRGRSYTKSEPMPSMITNVPMRTGTRSREAPSLAATPSPRMATSDRLTEAATRVPASAHTARVLSAPKRRNQRKP